MARKLKPIHPGEHLWEDFMKPFGLASNALARALKVTPARINEIVRERRSITAETALRLACFLGTDAQRWVEPPEPIRHSMCGRRRWPGDRAHSAVAGRPTPCGDHGVG